MEKKSIFQELDLNELEERLEMEASCVANHCKQAKELQKVDKLEAAK